MSNYASSIGKNGIALTSIALFSGQTFGDVSTDYAPLPVYGNIQMNSATCSITSSSTAPAVSWIATPGGYGYPATLFQCSGYYRILVLTGSKAGGTCTGTFSPPSVTVGGVFTDPYGTLNPGQLAVTFVSPTSSVPGPSCSGLVSASGINTSITTFPTCSLAIGGSLDNLLTGFAASCVSN